MLIEDFSFNGIKLSEKNGYLTSENKELYQLVPSYTIVEHTVPNVGETKFIKKVRNPYEFRLELFFMDIPTLTEIKTWLDTVYLPLLKQSLTNANGNLESLSVSLPTM